VGFSSAIGLLYVLLFIEACTFLVRPTNGRLHIFVNKLYNAPYISTSSLWSEYLRNMDEHPLCELDRPSDQLCRLS
jgi:hypothetical protein